MLLSDLGADIVRIDRPSGVGGTGPNPVLQRGRPSILLDLKTPHGVSIAVKAAQRADVLMEGNRPGVMERLGLGPDRLLENNPGLIYARMTGYGQYGPLASTAGHDINYLAVTGALDAISEPGSIPRAPLNLLGDFGGGALYLALGIASALFERAQSGRGQVIDAAIVDGTASLMGYVVGAFAAGSLRKAHQSNMLSGAAPFYRCYECADGRHIAIGAIEPQFYRRFMDAMGMDAFASNPQRDPAGWPQICAALTATFKTETLEHWLEILEPLDACVSAVLTLEEAIASPHANIRSMFSRLGRIAHPAPAPRFSRTAGAIQSAAHDPDEGGLVALRSWDVPLED